MIGRQRLISFVLVVTLVLLTFFPTQAAIYENDAQATKELPCIYAFQHSNLQNIGTKEQITDFPLLEKAIAYVFHSYGYSMNHSVFDEFYLQHQCLTEEEKIIVSGDILSDIYLNQMTDLVRDFLSVIEELPDYDENFVSLYVYDEQKQLIGFTYERVLNQSEQLEQSEESLLGTSNGVYYNGHPNMNQFSKVDPKEYGFPYSNIPNTWFSASTNNQIEIAKVAFHYTSVNNSSATGALFGGANAVVTRTISGSYASDKLVGKSISLYHCLTGSKDSAPYEKDDSDSDSNLYIAKNPDNICYMHFYVRQVDTSSKKIYIEVRTDYIDADYNRKNTSVQSVGGGIWYSYQDDSYVTISKKGIQEYLNANLITQDANLSAFSLQGIQYGIYAENNKETPIEVFTYDSAGQLTPETIRLKSNTNYYFHEIKGNAFYKQDTEYYLFNSGEYSGNSLEQVLKRTFVDSVKPYSLYFHKEAKVDGDEFKNPLYDLSGALYTIKDKNGNYANVILGFEDKNNPNVYQKPIVFQTGEQEFITDSSGNLTLTFTYEGDSRNITTYYQHVQVEQQTYRITFTKDSPLQLFYGEYYIYETKPPLGYQIDEYCQDNGHSIMFQENSNLIEAVCEDQPVFTNFELQIQKQDAELSSDESLGKGSLENTIFQFDYFSSYFDEDSIPAVAQRTWYMNTDKDGKLSFQDSQCVTSCKSDSFFVWKNKRAVPLGTLVIRELQAPTGYLSVENHGKIYIDGKLYPSSKPILIQFIWNVEQQKIDIQIQEETHPSEEVKIFVQDSIQRGDLSFLKTDYRNGSPMGHIAFLLTSKTTGEKHILVTDDNGYATTKATESLTVHEKCYRPLHTKDTNANDQYLTNLSNSSILENTICPTGVWFYGTADQDKQNPELISDERGALPYDTYTITELFSYGNKTTQMILDEDFEFNVERDGQILMYSIADMPTPEFQTSSRDRKLNGHYSLPEKDTVIVDTIHYQYLKYDTQYTFKGILVAKEDCNTKDGHHYKAGEPILDAQGNYIRNSILFRTAKKPGAGYNNNANGYVDLIYHFDSSNLQGINGVWNTFLCKGTDFDPVIVDEEQKIDKEASNVLSYPISEEPS